MTQLEHKIASMLYKNITNITVESGIVEPDEPFSKEIVIGKLPYRIRIYSGVIVYQPNFKAGYSNKKITLNIYYYGTKNPKIPTNS